MKIAKSYVWISVTAIFCFEILISSAMAATDLPDVTALQLRRSDGGNPCVESWTGISYNGTAVGHINLAGLDLGGTLGWQLNLPNLWQLDLSFNRIEGEIPGSLPLNITYINLSHNSLSGPVSNLFGDLQILKEMDLSYNSFIGDLPSSFGNLTNLTALYLQNNNFTGSVTFLENLQLTDLNIQNNNFSGVLPKQFQRVPNLWIWGNAFQFGTDSPPWDFPQNNIPTDQNINSPPTNELNAIESYPLFGDDRNRQKRFSPVGIACGVVGVALVATCAAILFAVEVKRARALSLKDPEGGNNSSPISTKIDLSFAPEELPQSSTCTSSPVLVVRRLLRPRLQPSAIICLFLFLFFDMLLSSASAATQPCDVTALQDLYQNLGYPPQLKGWRSYGGDPCGELWTGISCDGTSVRVINLAGLDLGGTLGRQLNLPNLWQLDLSFNHIEGEIPGSLPLNVTYIDLSSNRFSRNIPYSLAFMKHLRHLNLSHNLLNGHINDVFGNLRSLEQMDLSYNSFSGYVPHSMGSLMDLTTLYLQTNNFTGSIDFLNNLILGEVNFEGNSFDDTTCQDDLYSWSSIMDDSHGTIRAQSSLQKPRKKNKGFGDKYIWGLIICVVGGVIWRLMLGWRVRNWRDDMMRVSLDYSKCDGIQMGVIEFFPNTFGGYLPLIHYLCQLCYGRLIGRLVAMDYLSERGLAEDIDREVLNRLIPLGQYSLDLTWCRFTNTVDYIPLTPQTDWEDFGNTVRHIRVRPTGPIFAIVSVPWLPPVHF